MTTRTGLLAYVHIMKTGGQTMCDILRQSFPGRHCDLQVKGVGTADDLRFARRFYPRLKSIAGHGVVPLSDLAAGCDSIRYFAFLRDPVERCISHYHSREGFQPDRNVGHVQRFAAELLRCLPETEEVPAVALNERRDFQLVRSLEEVTLLQVLRPDDVPPQRVDVLRVDQVENGGQFEQGVAQSELPLTKSLDALKHQEIQASIGTGVDIPRGRRR